MRQSPLHEIHKSLSAKFAEVDGWGMPANYGDPVAEHLAVRKGVGIMDISHRGKVSVSGKDRTKFLQKILSQDMNKLAPGTGGYSTLLNTKGHMLAYMRIYSDEESFLIDTEPGLAEKIVQALTHYLFREDVKIEDVTLKYGLITIQGPRSRELLGKVGDADVKDMAECAHTNLSINNVSCRVVRTTYTGEEGYDIYVPWNDAPGVWQAILSGGIGHEITPFGLYALETLRIEAGTPVYNVDMDEDTIPIEANLDKAVSYDKGCYVGQETIARIKFRGHVNMTLTGISITNPSLPAGFISQKGDSICEIIGDSEHDIGFITSGCFSPTLNRPIALGYLRVEHSKPGKEVFIDKGSKRIAGTVARLPFYNPP